MVPKKNIQQAARRKVCGSKSGTTNSTHGTYSGEEMSSSRDCNKMKSVAITPEHSSSLHTNTPQQQSRGQENGSVTATVSSTPCSPLHQVWNRATEFAQCISSKDVGDCGPCSTREKDYISLHTCQTFTPQHNKQIISKQREPLAPKDINIEIESLDSSLTSTCIGIDQKNPTTYNAKGNYKDQKGSPMQKIKRTPTKIYDTSRNKEISNIISPSPSPSTKRHPKLETKATTQQNPSSQSHRRNSSMNFLSNETKNSQSNPNIRNNEQQKRPHKQHVVPVELIKFTIEEAARLQKSISELTMRSCNTEARTKLQQQHHLSSSDDRRMAYYAVGRDNCSGLSGRGVPGGNRRCYFSGRLIKNGRPFYAGSVRKGLRTMVVFCLPGSLGLPGKSNLDALLSVGGSAGRAGRSTVASNSLYGYGSASTHALPGLRSTGSYDEDMRAVEETEILLDQGVIRPEQVLDILPNPGTELLKQMESRFPEQYSTLPQEVRSAKCWRLYFKFCFFSGLPIADGEMYYKVTEKIMEKVKCRSKCRDRADSSGNASRKRSTSRSKKDKTAVTDELVGLDEIILSHEIMEAVNGEQSAEILRLPNKKTFRYLQKQYTKQCAKLGGLVFDRTSWEMVKPEI